MADVVVQADKLTELTKLICMRAGSEEAEAQMVADRLVEANLAGHDSHGVGMMPAYISAVVEGRLNVGQHAEVVVDKGCFLLVDGNAGYGQVIAQETTEMGIAKAREHGVAVVGLRNSHHIGRIGAWGEMCADAGFVSIHYVNSTSYHALVAPFGGSDPRYTTNPYCTAIPATKDHPRLILDMATSNIAMGKVRVAHNKGVSVPDGSLIDEKGNPTNDPGVMFRGDGEPTGALLSVGAHKGYGLALICDILAGGVTGGGTFLPERLERGTIINNMLMIILDPDIFDASDFFGQDLNAFTDWVKASPPAPGVEAVMVPGDPERKRRDERLAKGIPIDATTWRELLDTAQMAGMNRVEIEAFAA